MRKPRSLNTIINDLLINYFYDPENQELKNQIDYLKEKTPKIFQEVIDTNIHSIITLTKKEPNTKEYVESSKCLKPCLEQKLSLNNQYMSENNKTSILFQYYMFLKQEFPDYIRPPQNSFEPPKQKYSPSLPLLNLLDRRGISL